MKKLYKKIILAAVAIFLVFSTVVTINVININKNRTNDFQSKKLFPIRILFVDKKDTPKDVTLNEVFTDHFDSILYAMNKNIPLTKKESDYYIIDLHNFVNENVLKQLSGEVFAKYNLKGEVVTDIVYDSKSKTIKVPTSYYDDSKKGYQMPVQGEFIDVIGADELQNIEIPVQITNNITKNKIVKINAKENEIKFSVLKYKNNKKLTKDDLDIYLNSSKNKLKTSEFDYNSTTGVITLNSSPIFINNIDVQFNKRNLVTRIASRIVNMMNAEAVINTDSKYKLASAPVNVSVGTTFSYSLPTYYKDTIQGDPNPMFNAATGTPWSRTDNGSNASRISWATAAERILTDNEDIANVSSDILHAIDMPRKLENSSGAVIDFGVERRLKLACVHISEAAYGLNEKEDGNTVAYTIKVITYDSSSRTLTLGFLSAGLNNQSAFGSQSAWGVYSFYWDEDTGYLQITKERIGADGDTASRTFKAYNAGSDGKCGTSDDSSSKGSCTVTSSQTSCKIGYDSSTSKGTLPYGKYCIWEDGDEDGGSLDNNYITSYSPTQESGGGYNYAKVTLNDSSSGSAGAKYATATVTNRRRKWCFVARKTDIEGGAVIKGAFTFQTNTGLPAVTLSTSNAIARFEHLHYDKVYNSSGTIIAKVTETASSSQIDTDINKKFWQIKNEKTVASGSIKEETYSNGTWTCPATSTFTTFTNIPNVRVYYCVKIIKKDSANNLLAGAQFTLKNGNLSYTSVETSSGRHSVFIEDNPLSYTAEETTVPNGYAKVDNFTVPTSKIITLPMYVPSTRNNTDPEPLIRAKAKALCESDNTVDSTYTAVKDNAAYEISKTDYKLLLNWYKVTENQSTKANGAKFKVYKCPSSGTCTTSNGTLVKFTARANYKDSSNDTRSCYNLASNGTISELESATIGANNTHKGEVCITGLEKGDYLIEETHPAKYHTFGTVVTKKLTVTNSSTAYKEMDDSNKFINLKTTFKFKKDVTDTDASQKGNTKYTIVKDGVTKQLSLSEMTIEQLKLITFRVYPQDDSSTPNVDESKTALNLIQTGEGTYEYDQNPDVDKSSITTKTTDLHLTGTSVDNMTITIDHLPVGKYSIKEVDSSVCQIGTTAGYGNVTNPTTRPSNLPNCNNSTGNSGTCIGYYSPDYSQASSHQFEITECSNDDANATKCPSGTNVHASQRLTNKPTEIILTKKDFYSYDDAADIQDTNRDKDSKESTAEFENDKERSDFDRIDFKVKDTSGNYLNLIYVGKHGDCKTDSSYSIYRYIPGLQLTSGVSADVFNSTIGGTTQTLHACGGHIKIINLCRGNKYTFEEIKVPDDSVYAKVGNPSACFTIPCSEGETTTPTSETHIINDKGTRVRFEKRDSKYNYLIPDETTTFKVYRCPKVNGVFTTCNPSAYNTDAERTAAGMKLVKFAPRKVIAGDEEDPQDGAGADGVEVYNMMSDSDVAAGKQYVTDLHPYHGILVLRYLQSGYNYVLLETKAPKNYLLPTGTGAETPFTVKNDTVTVKEVDVPNAPTSLLIKKYDDNGKLLAGAQFRIYEGKTCDPNLSAMNQPKDVLKLKTIRDGVYEARPPYDDSEFTVVQTCDDENGVCNNIPTNEQTRLTYENSIFNDALNNTYVDSYADFENLTDRDLNTVEINEGEALIQYLEYGHCYIVEEIKAPKGHSLPKRAEDRFTMVTIEEDEKYIVDTGKALVNKPTPFTFYKFDEYNQLLDGAEFKLQKLDDDKKYNDITVTEIEEKGMLFYKVDPETDNTTIRTKNGSATVYYLEPGQYRILETSPAPGKELSKNPNIATFFVDEAGNVYGNSIIVNKSTTAKNETINESSAEFIIGIQTGQTVIRYGIIIGVLVALITGLMILRKKSK